MAARRLGVLGREKKWPANVGRAGIEPATNGLTIGMVEAARLFLNHVEQQPH
jgi:hypothetical protein